MAFPKKIETERLILRPYNRQDLDAHVEILGNWDVTQWLSNNVPFPFQRSDGEKSIAEAMQQFEEGSSIRYVMEDKASGRHVGGIRVFTVTPETEVGYWMHPDFWGKGLGTEVLNAVIKAGFETGVIKKFIAQTAAKNKGSRRILEKVGFIHGGDVPAEYQRCGHSSGCSEFFQLTIENFEHPEKTQREKVI